MKKLLLLFVAVAFLSGLSLAQVDYPGIYGTVVLADGSMIPGVTVILTDTTGVKQTTVTSEEGNFRFLRNNPGEYELRFELDGFKTIIRKGIRLFLGKNVTLTVPMDTTTIREEVVVTAKASNIDTRKTTVSANITSEQIASLPSSRNAWTMLSLVPGMMVDRVDVGGAESGQQSSFTGLGGSGSDATWNIDGANMTDISATGSAPAYLDVSAYDEMQVTLGSNDIGSQTGGVQINFVTKKAGNRVTGDFHLYMQQSPWEMTQTLPDNLVAQGLVPPGINRLMQYGSSLGGPVIKDKLWWVGSYGIQDIKARTMPGKEDATWLVSGYAKLNFQLGNTSGDFHLTYDDKQKFGRTQMDPTQQGEGTLWDQVTPSWMYFGSLQQVLGNLMLNAKVMYTDGGFVLNPRGSNVVGGYEVGKHAYRYGSPTYIDGSTYDYFTNRNNLNIAVSGNLFAEKVFNADHEIRFGVDIVNATTTSQTLYANGLYAVYYSYKDLALNTNPWDKQLWFNQDGILDVVLDRLSFYASDTATFGKLTVNLGLRYDAEQGTSNPFIRHALKLNGTTPILAQYMGDFTAKEVKSAKFSTISPRLSFSYDLSGDGKNVVKLSLARYGSQTGNNLIGQSMRGYSGFKEMDFYWYDLNNNNIPEVGEWDENAYAYCSFDPKNPNPKDITSIFASDYKSPQLDELTVSFERQFSEDMVMQLAGYYKKNSKRMLRFNYYGTKDSYTVDTPDNFEVVNTIDVEGVQVPVYDRKKAFAYGSGSYFRNANPGTYQRYLGLQLMLSKKFSHKWMADVSVTLQDQKQYWELADWISFGNGNSPNNYAFYNGAIVAPESSGSGYTEIFMQSRWMVKANFLLQLPLDINLTGVLDAREGFVTQHYVKYNLKYVGAGYKMLNADKQHGDDRLGTMWTLNMGLEKNFKISDTATATVFCDGYNLLNNDTAQKIDGNLKSLNFGSPLRILNPGIFQFGVRIAFK